MKKILIINAHPGQTSLSSSLSEAYFEGAQDSGMEVKLLHISQLKFDPILREGYKVIQELEADLVMAQQRITEAEHVVIVSPVWWGGVPALFKGFLDRAFLPGYAFKYQKNSPWWDRLLKGRTSRIIITSDGPLWWNQFVYGDPTIRMLKKSVLEFCGFKVKVSKFGNIKNLKGTDISKVVEVVKKLGKRGL